MIDVKDIKTSKTRHFCVKQTCSCCGGDVYLHMDALEYDTWNKYRRYNKTNQDSRISGFDQTKSIFLIDEICPECQALHTKDEISTDGFIYESDCRKAVMRKFNEEMRKLKQPYEIVDAMQLMKELKLSPKEKAVCLYEYDLETDVAKSNEYIDPALRVSTSIEAITATDAAAYYQLLKGIRSTAELIFSDKVHDDNRFFGIHANGIIDYPNIPDAEKFEEEHPGKVIHAYLITRTSRKSCKTDLDYNELNPSRFFNESRRINDWEEVKNKREFRIIDFTETDDEITAFVADMSKNLYGRLVPFLLRLMKIHLPVTSTRIFIKHLSPVVPDTSVYRMLVNGNRISRLEKRESEAPALFYQNKTAIYAESNQFMVKNEKEYLQLIAGIYSDSEIRHRVWRDSTGTAYFRIECDGPVKSSYIEPLEDFIDRYAGKEKKIILYEPKSHTSHDVEKENGRMERIEGWCKVPDVIASTESYLKSHNVYFSYETDDACVCYVEKKMAGLFDDVLSYYIGIQQILDLDAEHEFRMTYKNATLTEVVGRDCITMYFTDDEEETEDDTEDV